MVNVVANFITHLFKVRFCDCRSGLMSQLTNYLPKVPVISLSLRKLVKLE
jgi:hypothetical protein